PVAFNSLAHSLTSTRSLHDALPIFFAFTHCRDVVVAVSKAGGFGVLGAVGFTPEQLEIELNWIDENIGDHPYGVDIVIPNKYEGDRKSTRLNSSHQIISYAACCLKT